MYTGVFFAIHSLILYGFLEMTAIDSTELEVPSKPVEIDIETPDMARKREKK